jgi:hypothetical protein
MCSLNLFLLLLQAYIGLPTLAARYEMLRTSLIELCRAGIIEGMHLVDNSH